MSLYISPIVFSEKKCYLFLANSTKDNINNQKYITSVLLNCKATIQLTLTKTVDYVIIIHSQKLLHHERFHSNLSSIFNKAKEFGVTIISSTLFQKKSHISNIEQYKILNVDLEKKLIETVGDKETDDFFNFFGDDIGEEKEDSDSYYSDDSDDSDEEEEEDLYNSNYKEDEKEVKEYFESDYLADFQNIGYFEDSRAKDSNYNNNFEYLIDAVENIKGYIIQYQIDKFKISHDEVKSIQVNDNGFTFQVEENNQIKVFGRLIKGLKVQHAFETNVSLRFKLSAIGKSHILLLARNHKCFTIGSNTYGQLGEIQGNTAVNSQGSLDIFNPIYIPQPVSFISCGDNFCIALTNTGQVYSWGQNDFGQLGHGHANNLTKPTQIQKFKQKKIVYITAGEAHVLALDNDNKIYAWGSNLSKQLPQSFKNTYEPNLVSSTKNSDKKKLFAHQNYSIIISQPNHLEYFGPHNPSLLELLNDISLEFKDLQDYQLLPMKSKLSIKVLNPYYSLRIMIKTMEVNKFSKHFQSVKDKLPQEDLKSLLSLTIQYNQLEMFKLLYNAFPDKLILHECSLHRFNNIPNYLISSSLVDINQVNQQKQTALHICAYNGNEIVAKLLLHASCDRNLMDSNQHTAMHVAVKQRNQGIYILLAKHGAQSIPDKSMKTPVQYLLTEYDKSLLQSAIFTNEIFISYAHKDSKFVGDLRLRLESFSLRCWLDEYRLQAGCDWRAEITKGLEGCQFVFFIISETSVNSLWCRKELKIARAQGKFIIPIQLQDIPIDPVIRGLFYIQPRVIFSEISSDQVHKELVYLSQLIKSNQMKQQYQTNAQLLDKFQRSRMIYFTFSNSDRGVCNLIKELVIARGIPTLSRDDIFGIPLPKDDEFSQMNLKKVRVAKLKDKLEKERIEKETLETIKRHRNQVRKLKFKLDKKLAKDPISFPETQEYYQLTNKLGSLCLEYNLNENGEDIQSNNSEFEDSPKIIHHTFEFKDVEIQNLSFDRTQVDRSQFYQLPEEEEVIEDDEITKAIKDSLLHLVLFTNKSDQKFLEREIEISMKSNKTIIIVTPNLQFKSLASGHLQSLPWFQVDYQQEDILIDNIIYNYEIIEKTLTLYDQRLQVEQQLAAAIELKEKRDQEEALKQKRLKRQMLLNKN